MPLRANSAWSTSRTQLWLAASLSGRPPTWSSPHLEPSSWDVFQVQSFKPSNLQRCFLIHNRTGLNSGLCLCHALPDKEVEGFHTFDKSLHEARPIFDHRSGDWHVRSEQLTWDAESDGRTSLSDTCCYGQSCHVCRLIKSWCIDGYNHCILKALNYLWWPGTTSSTATCRSPPSMKSSLTLDALTQLWTNGRTTR